MITAGSSSGALGDSSTARAREQPLELVRLDEQALGARLLASGRGRLLEPCQPTITRAPESDRW